MAIEAPIVAVNPFTGVRLVDLLSISAKTLGRGLTQPLILGKHAASLSRKLLEVATGERKLLPARHDRRFADPAWQKKPLFSALTQFYLALDETAHEWSQDVDFDELDQVRAQFLLRLLLESVSPSNFLLSNPEALQLAIDTHGDSLKRGLRNLLEDIRHNHGLPAQVKRNSFELGRDIATTPGSVVFRNDLLELIQYKSSTRQVHNRPVLIIPPQINKYYAADLSPHNSMVKFLVDSGMQTFCISWCNPTPAQADAGIVQYAQAVQEAVAAIRSICKVPDINVAAFCSGAMTFAALASHLQAKNDGSINALTIGVCILEGKPEDSELGAFGSDAAVAAAKKLSRRKGVLRGDRLALSMLWMRPQDLIWGNVVNNYLLGKEPPEFDILAWNNDWTNLPAQLHSDYLDVFWQQSLTTPGALSIDGIPVDLKTVQCDKFVVAGLTDHITPWKACYRSLFALGGDTRFILSNSGHVQTLLNSPAKRGASYFENDALPLEADDWFKGSMPVQGSWWIEWQKWLTERAGPLRAAPKTTGNRKHPALCDAPGTYVFQTIE